ncbi:MAG TPA: J domain-containing protein [Candidatus Limnocylindrales bacterium]|nr:J domain-containing protein [Candidatus Limnocylindrales bacterium]
MPKREPHDVLGVPRGASQATIKAAWRKLAREHHPDVAGSDAAAARSATRRMAEINRAYEQLRIGTPGSGSRDGSDGASGRRTAWPPRTRPTRPVTGRVDTSETFRPRNATTGGAAPLPGQPPLKGDRFDREPPRASQPTGPLDRARDPRFRPAPLPEVGVAAATPIDFGKFHGHTLGEIAAFEPSYIDWLARTISHDPELVAAARALQADLDRRGVIRRPRPVPAR